MTGGSLITHLVLKIDQYIFSLKHSPDYGLLTFLGFPTSGKHIVCYSAHIVCVQFSLRKKKILPNDQTPPRNGQTKR